MLRHVPEVSVEEFIDGEEFTYDTVCAGGSILYENIMWYRPRPLQMKSHEWISPASIILRDLDVPDLQGGRQMGGAVLPALDFRTGFTHMEWYRKADGEAVFGEIGARPPGARAVDLMNYATMATCFVVGRKRRAWPAVRPLERKFNAVVSSSAPEASGESPTLRAWTSCWPMTAHSTSYSVVAADARAPRRDWGHAHQRRDDHRAASRLQRVTR